MTGLPRRDLLRSVAAAGFGVAAGAVGGWSASRAFPAEAAESGEPESARETAAPGAFARVDPHGAHQAGIARPSTPQAHEVVTVLDLPDVPAADGADETFRSGLSEMLAHLGELITALVEPGPDGESARSSAGMFEGPRDLTVTVGLGPRALAALDSSLPGAEPLPAFAGDARLPAERTGGDLLIAVCSSDVNDAAAASRALIARSGAVPRWAQRGFRGVGAGTVARSPIGFLDGIIVPHGDREMSEHVWIADGPLAGGTICVIRRLRIDIERFRALAQPQQEGVVGRRRGDGSPLSGGARDDEVDLLAKTPEGEFVVPARSHVRAAHPSFTGSALMLRRGYGFDDGIAADGTADAGLLFTCFQRDLRTFVQTQHRLDEVDDLMGFTTTTASASFAILPGFGLSHPLGSTLP
ncbi:Dyp-type peroxidase [Microbacterium sp. JZ101]